MRGLPLSWGPAVATVYIGQQESGHILPPRVIWSPCSKFIAASRESVEVLDAVTLNRLATFEHPTDCYHLSFSPDSCSLTLFTGSQLISWDIQTGGRLSEIPGKSLEELVQSFAYSKDGKMVAVACINQSCTEYKVYTFDLPSRTCLGPLPVSDADGLLVPPIWSHNEYLRFATMRPGSITIWELEFTLIHPPTKVESFPIPDEVLDGDDFLFLPVRYRLAFALDKTIQVLDVKTSKLLLKSDQVSGSYPRHSFSSDGHFFASAIAGQEVRIWKESPTGYALHQQPPLLFDSLQWPFLSPNGGSMIFPLNGTINLWQTGDQTLSPPSPPTEEYNPQDDFILAFSPDEKSAAFAQSYGNVVTILDLRSGDLRLTIDTGMEVKCIGVAGDTIIVIDRKRFVTWNIPGGDCAFGASINDSVRTVMFDHSRLSGGFLQSLSPDLSCVAAIGSTYSSEGPGRLQIYEVTTGTYLASTEPELYYSPLRFTRDGREVWVMEEDRGERGWEIIKGGVSGAMELKPLEETLYPSSTFLWDSIRGYKVTDDGWVLSPTQKRLLWLPHRWRSDREYRLWSGRFLGLSHRLSEVVILEFLE